MVVVVAGSRGIDQASTYAALAVTGFEIDQVVEGEASGTDTHSRWWAQERGIPVAAMPADWQRYGKSAGPRRNAAMGAVMDAAVIVWDGESRGAWDMVEVARRLRKPYELLGPIPSESDIEYG